jgi:dTDP-4-dehydrorhamnose 3,5-epimerase
MMDQPRLIKSPVYHDNRGTFCESFRASDWEEHGIKFVTDSYSWSYPNVFRGFHYQTVNPQGKLVSVIHGCIYDICIDVRDGSDNRFGACYHFVLRDDEDEQLWIPPGFAHGYCARRTNAVVMYKATQYRNVGSEVVIGYDDPHINIRFPNPLIVSHKDSNGIFLKDAPRVRV